MIFEKRLIRTEPRFKLLSKLWRINWLCVILVSILAGVGYMALYSAAGGSPYPYARPQLIRFCVGFVLMIGVAITPLRFIAKLAWPFYLLGIVSLLAVLYMGHVGKGAERWLVVGGMALQPSEFMKIGLIILLSSWFHKMSWKQIANPLRLIVPSILVILPVLLVLKQPNLGTAVIIGCIGASIFFAAGMRYWQIFLLIFPLPFLFKLAYSHLHDYQKARITTFLHPESDPLGAGYNIIQSKIALGSGGMWGQGFLHGTQGQLNFLPEKQTDFIFTMIAEEWGFVGGSMVILLLLSIVVMGMIITMRSKCQFGRLLSLGLTMNFFLYCVVNLSMVMGAIPVGGVPLPMVSYGGSAMLTVMFGFGLLLSVQVHRNSDFGSTDSYET
ncbi:Peptidoglycan glycosyltransferase MrdB [Commensalibacter sp. Nvir]|uniref:rod shape-determining protein RodA n=1 Tax=Commensalibacter sp. Nvir TaxID=3069817 RepID=UPI002D447C32|nr:Peptidoglycan glycosyltransferase MrdB [Commensalibacter sp. Nvir]